MKDATVKQALIVSKMTPPYQLSTLDHLRMVSFKGTVMTVRLCVGVTLTVTLAENPETKKLGFKDAVFSTLDGRNKFLISMKTVKAAKKKEEKKKLIGWMSSLKKFMLANGVKKAPAGMFDKNVEITGRK